MSVLTHAERQKPGLKPFAFRRFKINWRLKVVAFWFFTVLPRGGELYLFFQKYVSKTVPRRMSPTSYTARSFVENWKSLESHFGRDSLPNIQMFEFGAGWDLFGNLIYWCMGANNQLVYDQTRWARPEQINTAIRHLQTDPPAGATRVPSRQIRLEAEFWEADLKEFYGIVYRAPADAAATKLPDESIDAIVTTSVFEHLPHPVALAILKECRRILRKSGVMSHAIDYSDHYAHSDATIGPYNFLKYSSEHWRLCNPSIHYQNRLRHVDYETMFLKTRFVVVEAKSVVPAEKENSIELITLAPEYTGRNRDDLAPIYGQFVLQ